MTDRQKELLRNYGPRFVKNSGNILTAMLHLAGDAQSCLADEEWKDCADAFTRFFDELEKVRLIVRTRLEDELDS